MTTEPLAVTEIPMDDAVEQQPTPNIPEPEYSVADFTEEEMKQILGDEADLESYPNPEASTEPAQAQTPTEATQPSDTAKAYLDAMKAAADPSAGQQQDASTPDVQAAVQQAVARAMQQREQQIEQERRQQAEQQAQHQPQAQPQQQDAPTPEEARQLMRDAMVATIDASRHLFEDDEAFERYRTNALSGEFDADALARFNYAQNQRAAYQKNAQVADTVAALNQKMDAVIQQQQQMQAAQMQVAATQQQGDATVSAGSKIGRVAMLDAKAMAEFAGVPFDAANPAVQAHVLSAVTANMTVDQVRSAVRGKIREIADAQQGVATAAPAGPAAAPVAQLPPNTANLTGGDGVVPDSESLTNAILDPNGAPPATWNYVIENAAELLSNEA